MSFQAILGAGDDIRLTAVLLTIIIFTVISSTVISSILSLVSDENIAALLKLDRLLYDLLRAR